MSGRWGLVISGLVAAVLDGAALGFYLYLIGAQPGQENGTRVVFFAAAAVVAAILLPAAGVLLVAVRRTRPGGVLYLAGAAVNLVAGGIAIATIGLLLMPSMLVLLVAGLDAVEVTRRR